MTWPVVLRITSAPCWLFFRLAIVTTLALSLPDLYLLAKHEPPEAVAVLMTMHLITALITYNFLVHLAACGDGASIGEVRTGLRGCSARSIRCARRSRATLRRP